jgi:hypothetical protein
MNKRRLEALCRKLDTIPRKRFDYNHWVDVDWEGKPDLSCGTSACALGWATTVPCLRQAGLRLVKRDEGGYVHLRGSRLNLSTTDPSLSAAEHVFDITRDEAYYLFIPSYDLNYGPAKPDTRATAKQVASHIRKFIERGGMPR